MKLVPREMLYQKGFADSEQRHSLLLKMKSDRESHRDKWTGVLVIYRDPPTQQLNTIRPHYLDVNLGGHKVRRVAA